MARREKAKVWEGWEGRHYWILTAPRLEPAQAFKAMHLREVEAVAQEIRSRGYWLEEPYTVAFWAALMVLRAAAVPKAVPQIIREVGVQGRSKVKLPRAYAAAAITALLRLRALQYRGGKVVASEEALARLGRVIGTAAMRPQRKAPLLRH